MFLLFNMLSKFVIAFLLRRKCLLISWLQSPFTVILETKKTKSVITSISSPSICREVMAPDAMILVFWMCSSLSQLLHPPLSPFSFFLLSAIRVVSSAYLKLLVFLLAILIPACDSSSLTFHMMYSPHKWNKQSDNIQPCHTPFPVLNQSIVPCPVITVAFWPAYIFLRRQVTWSGIPSF